jgi:hypothetical protein
VVVPLRAFSGPRIATATPSGQGQSPCPSTRFLRSTIGSRVKKPHAPIPATAIDRAWRSAISRRVDHRQRAVGGVVCVGRAFGPSSGVTGHARVESDAFD